jgi:hypothetical protein
VTYGSDHVADGRKLTELLNALERDLSEVRQLLAAYDDAVTMPGRRQSGVDADGGRQAAHGISRPTERVALDERRTALHAELKNGASRLPYAVAVVRGVSASMDRALARWEGEDASAESRGD